MKNIFYTAICSKVYIGILILSSYTIFAESIEIPPIHASGVIERFNNQMHLTMQKLENDTIPPLSLYFDMGISFEVIKTNYTWYDIIYKTGRGWVIDPNSAKIEDMKLTNFPLDAHSAFRFHKYFSFVINDFTTFQSNSLGNDLKMPTIMNIGPIFTTKFGSIGLFYGWEIDVPDNEDDSEFILRIVPNFNTKEYPYIGLILDEIEGFLGLKGPKVDSYNMSFFSRGFNIGKLHFQSINFYHRNMPYNWFVYNKAYGGQVILNNFIVEGGYQQFSEYRGISFEGDTRNVRVNLEYKDTPFGKLTYFSGFYDVFSVSAEMSANYYPMPKIIVSYTTESLINGSLFGHLYYSADHWEFGIGLRLSYTLGRDGFYYREWL